VGKPPGVSRRGIPTIRKLTLPACHHRADAPLSSLLGIAVIGERSMLADWRSDALPAGCRKRQFVARLRPAALYFSNRSVNSLTISGRCE